jgi:hypothetical protein
MTRPAVKRRAWSIALAHIPFFELTFRPIRDAILAAIEQALAESTPEDSVHD